MFQIEREYTKQRFIFSNCSLNLFIYGNYKFELISGKVKSRYRFVSGGQGVGLKVIRLVVTPPTRA